MTVSEQDRPVTAGEAPVARLSGDIHMWVMILGDLFFFGSYFVTYMVFRARSPEAFAAAQQQLHMGIGVVNTVVLLTSSLFAALAVLEVRQAVQRNARRLILAAGGCGVVFVLLKAVEWQRTIAAGHTVSSEFFSFYFVLTGVHLAHLLLGLLILGILVRRLSPAKPLAVDLIEQGVLYWHMVDLLWIVIFAILYLMR